MMVKKLTAILFCIIVTGGNMFTACSSKKEEKPEDKSETAAASATENTGQTTSAFESVEVEKAVEAQSGDAYLAIADGQWYVQYWGTDSDLLTYDAGVVPIKKNGKYTVSVNGATNGMLYDITESIDEEFTPSGCSFMAVIVKDGKLLYPDMSIDITSIRINGEEIERTARNYTTSDDDIEMIANIYNEWTDTLPEDAHDSDGAVTDSASYSARIVDKDKIGSWTKIEVDFTVSGIGGDSENHEDSEE